MKYKICIAASLTGMISFGKAEAPIQKWQSITSHSSPSADSAVYNITAADFMHIDLDYAGLEEVKKYVTKKHYGKAAEKLLHYYRERHSVNHIRYNREDKTKYAGKQLSTENQTIADNALVHKLKPHKGYPYYDYGRNDINWQYQPVQDQLIRTFLHRTNWWEQLGLAYWSSGDEKYAKAWMNQTTSWIDNNPLGRYPDEKNFAWKAFVVSFRLNNWSAYFNMFIDSPSLTPAFLMAFLNSYQQQADYVKANYTDIGNHLLYEALHMLYAGCTFPEFKNASKWRESGIQVLNTEMQKQVLADGVQFELSTSYHIGAIEIFTDALRIAQSNGMEHEFPKRHQEKIRKMIAAVANYSFPDYTYPLYGNSFEPTKSVMLARYQDWLALFPNDPELQYFSTEGKRGTPPKHLSFAMKNSGFYSFRNSWLPTATVMQIKAGPPAYFHAHPDNGTFNLWVKGRNFTPDSGSYIYNDNAKTNNKKDWYRQTRVHQTLTLNNENILNDAHLHRWATQKDYEVLSFTNPSYPTLAHQRTIFFIDQHFFLIIDRAMGEADGVLNIHFTLAEKSNPLVDQQRNKLVTRYADGNNLLIQSLDSTSVKLTTEKGFVSYRYQEEIERPAFSINKNKNKRTASFMTLMLPFDGQQAPATVVTANAGHSTDSGKIDLSVNIHGKIIHIQEQL
ncbi:heparin-sulfate lyase HepC [Sphingobacterium paludis]|uniref:Heparan-sulfate lyase n=1 Tax=Sphingobacterium paludis TaxID=1476465 RepID=A0A4R7CXJ1_9SPHI|nr:heparin-sulfate lyase HepC [Sphingobacterium paludis]TDS11824.1 heparan-sulfate lyase [Sphingobacterium paludis]